MKTDFDFGKAAADNRNSMIGAAAAAGEIDESSQRPIMVILSRSLQSLLQDYIAGSFGYSAEDQKAKFREIFEYLLKTGGK